MQETASSVLAGLTIRQRPPFPAMTREPTARQPAATSQETACSELYVGPSGDGSGHQAEPVQSSTRVCDAAVPS